MIGVPGSGKTILAQQYAFTNAHRERPAMYFSTVSEPLEKIIRFGQTLSFFDAAAVGTVACSTRISAKTSAAAGCPAWPSGSRRCCVSGGPGVVVIDSFKALTPYADERA